MNIETKNIIGYSTADDSGKYVQGVNPSTGELLEGKFSIATADNVDAALTKADTAFKNFKRTSNDVRASFLKAIADEMESLGDVLVQRASAETGLPEARIIGERGRTTGQLRMFAEHIMEGSYVEATIDTAIPDRAPIPKPDLRKMMVPLGPIVVFGASNFPLAYSVAGGDTAAAFAAGCPVIVKAHPGHPGTSALVGMAVRKAAQDNNLSDGVFSLVFDTGFTVGKALVEHPITAAVGFTGSTAGGRALFDMAAARPKPIPVFSEMGSVNPSILLPQALDKRAQQLAEAYAGSITLGVGQFCTNPGLILAVKGEGLSDFLDHLKNGIKVSAAGTMLHSGISKAYKSKSKEMADQSGVEIIQQADADGSGSQVRPAIAKAPGADFIANPKLHEEVFGPFSLVIECEDVNELSLCVSKLDGQLTTTINGEDAELIDHHDLISELREKAGRVIFNGVPTGVEVCPAMLHGGPYPATTDSRFTAVGTDSIKRFLRPVSFQDAPQAILPEALKNENPGNLWRLVNSEITREAIG